MKESAATSMVVQFGAITRIRQSKTIVQYGTTFGAGNGAVREYYHIWYRNSHSITIVTVTHIITSRLENIGLIRDPWRINILQIVGSYP